MGLQGLHGDSKDPHGDSKDTMINYSDPHVARRRSSRAAKAGKVQTDDVFSCTLILGFRV